jgi:hypothetical protein
MPYKLVKALNLANGTGSGLNSNGLPDASAATLTDTTSSGGLVCISSVCTGGLALYQDYAPVATFLAPYISKYPTDPVDGRRGATGYSFISNFGGGTDPAGNYIPPGGKVQFYLEPQSNLSCGAAILWKITAANQVCIMALN